MGLNRLEQKLWEATYIMSSVAGHSAGADILVHETTREAKLTKLVICSPIANTFEEIIRGHDGSNPQTKGARAIVSAGEIYPEAISFDNPELEWGANREIAIKGVSAMADTCRVSVRIHEKIG